MKQTDIITANLGSIIRIDADSARGLAWMRENVIDTRTEATDGAYTLAEHRYGMDIIVGAIAAGLRVRDVSGRLALLALLLCLLPAISQAEPLIISQSAFVIAQAADLHSTRYAEASGRGIEVNAVMREPWRRYALKAGATAGVLALSSRIARTRPKLARVFLYSCAAGIGTAAARNYRIGGTP